MDLAYLSGIALLVVLIAGFAAACGKLGGPQ